MCQQSVMISFLPQCPAYFLLPPLPLLPNSPPVQCAAYLRRPLLPLLPNSPPVQCAAYLRRPPHCLCASHHESSDDVAECDIHLLPHEDYPMKMIRHELSGKKGDIPRAGLPRLFFLIPGQLLLDSWNAVPASQHFFPQGGRLHCRLPWAVAREAAQDRSAPFRAERDEVYTTIMIIVEEAALVHPWHFAQVTGLCAVVHGLLNILFRREKSSPLSSSPGAVRVGGTHPPSCAC